MTNRGEGVQSKQMMWPWRKIDRSFTSNAMDCILHFFHMCASQCMIVQLVDLPCFVLTLIPIWGGPPNTLYERNPMSLNLSLTSSPYEMSLFLGLRAPYPSATSPGDVVFTYIQNFCDSRVWLNVFLLTSSHSPLTQMSTVTLTGDIPNLPLMQNSHKRFRSQWTRNWALCLCAWFCSPSNLIFKRQGSHHPPLLSCLHLAVSRNLRRHKFQMTVGPWSYLY